MTARWLCGNREGGGEAIVHRFGVGGVKLRSSLPGSLRRRMSGGIHCASGRIHRTGAIRSHRPSLPARTLAVKNGKASVQGGSSYGRVGWSEGNHHHHHQQEADLADGHYCGFQGAGAFRFHGSLLLLLVVCAANVGKLIRPVSSDRAFGGSGRASGCSGRKGLLKRGQSAWHDLPGNSEAFRGGKAFHGERVFRAQPKVWLASTRRDRR